MPKVNFGIATFTDGQDPVNGSEMVNCFTEVKQMEGEEAAYHVVGCAGSDLVSDGLDSVRALHSYNGELWGVVGNKLYRGLETPSPSIHFFGFSGNVADRAELSSTRTHINVVVGDKAYNAAGIGVLTQNPFTAEPLASTDTLNGVTLYSVTDSDKLYASDRLSSAVQGLSFAVAEARPDKIVKVVVTKLTVWLFGPISTELWYDAGTTPFPLARYQNAMIEVGLAGPRALTNFQNTVCWLASDRRVYLGEGLQSAPISTRGLEHIISKVPAASIEAAYMFHYAAFGRVFYGLTIPDVGTWEYDNTDKLWHTRKGQDGGVWEVTSAAYHAEDKEYYLGTSDGRILRVNGGKGTEGENQIVHEIISVLEGSQENRRTNNYLQLDFGLGQSASPGTFTLTYSDDGGNTFKNPRTRPLPALGKRPRVVLRGLGQSRQRRWKVTTDTLDRFAVENVYLNQRRDGH